MSTYPARACSLCPSAHFAASPSQGCVSAARGASPRSSPSPARCACGVCCRVNMLVRSTACPWVLFCRLSCFLVFRVGGCGQKE
eukprot:3390464-Rhodomonas_salina.1